MPPLPLPSAFTRVPGGTPLLSAIVLPTDFSAGAEGLLPIALVIAERAGAVVHLVHVLAPVSGGAGPWREQQARARLASTRMHYWHGLLGQAQMQVSVLAPGDARDALAAYVTQQGAAFVLGTMQQRERFAAVPYPVLLVPPGHPSALRRLVSTGAPGELAVLLGHLLAVPVMTLEPEGACDIRADALLVARRSAPERAGAL